MRKDFFGFGEIVLFAHAGSFSHPKASGLVWATTEALTLAAREGKARVGDSFKLKRKVGATGICWPATSCHWKSALCPLISVATISTFW
ncbi:MAG TPA: hypothetical protein VFJ01_01580 [Oleiagrimonas sp.]|nr:hypothetical protein [Oleiagrimonas sp.]